MARTKKVVRGNLTYFLFLLIVSILCRDISGAAILREHLLHALTIPDELTALEIT